MAFTIHHSPSGYKAYDDSYTMTLKDSGVIEVTKDGEQVRLFSPSYWTFVEPKERKPGKAVRLR
ncbi:hypothetical protein [Mycobacterium riyadhense]|uniref:hypothetical protein n=1 Tax=Mycobacterium riyadhense TaxID=486698 RepID=UPI00195A2BF5|nr:hypothetical protein [Mycobacterium riyadhense]